jgi:hypothetical protein
VAALGRFDQVGLLNGLTSVRKALLTAERRVLSALDHEQLGTLHGLLQVVTSIQGECANQPEPVAR